MVDQKRAVLESARLDAMSAAFVETKLESWESRARGSQPTRNTMNTKPVLIDPSTGMVPVAGMFKCARPDVSGTGMLRTICTNVEDTTGGPQLPRYLINGWYMSTASRTFSKN